MKLEMEVFTTRLEELEWERQRKRGPEGWLKVR
jgi:hypothetical protein